MAPPWTLTCRDQQTLPESQTLCKLLQPNSVFEDIHFKSISCTEPPPRCDYNEDDEFHLFRAEENVVQLKVVKLNGAKSLGSAFPNFSHEAAFLTFLVYNPKTCLVSRGDLL